MEPNELRIGNYLESKNWSGNGQVEGVELMEYGFDVRIKGIVHKSNSGIYFDIQPILLTEEWLIKFGFVSQVSFYKVYRGEKFDNGSLSLEVAHNDQLKWYCYVRNFNKGKLDDFSLLRSDLKHVHQLQNLYFALCGEELEILIK